MAEAVLDSSAVLALINGETGGDRVAEALDRCTIGTVNLAEVMTKLVDRGLARAHAEAVIAELTCELTVFDADQALRAGALRASTRRWGLSLGDRACIALADREGLPVMTTDRAWADAELPVVVDVIR